MLLFCLILLFPPFHFLPLLHFCLCCSLSPRCHCFFSFLLVLLCFCFSFFFYQWLVLSDPHQTPEMKFDPDDKMSLCKSWKLFFSCVCWITTQIQVSLLKSYFESLLSVVFEVSGRNICWCLSVFTETECVKAEITNCTQISPSIVSWTQWADNCWRTLNLITHLLHLAADCFCSSVIILLFTCKSCAAVRPLSADK